MDYFLLFGLIGFGCLILGILGYTTITNKIIKEQEQEIRALDTEVKRLKSAYKKLKRVESLIIDSDNPSFKEW